MKQNKKRILSILLVLLLVLVGIQMMIGVSAKRTTAMNAKGMGMKRHPDSIHDAQGRHHMVWQEPRDGQYDIFYSVQLKSNKKELGLGSNANTVIQISDTPTDSHHPKITIDLDTDIIYILWTEETTMDILDSDGGTFTSKSLFYSAAVFEPNDEPVWTIPQNLAEGNEQVKSFSVKGSEYVISGYGWKPAEFKGTMDTDKDTIKDSDEVLGKLGYVTKWNNDDSDDDGLLDNLEYVHQFNPLIDERFTPLAKTFIRLLTLLSDDDDDGFTYSEEQTCDKPVTVRVAHVLNTGYATYTFFPKADHSASLVVDLEIRRYGILYIPPPVTASYSIDVTVESESLDAVEFTISGSHMEWEWFKAYGGSFNVYEDEETTVTIDVSVSQPDSSDYRTLAIASVMIAAPSPDYHLFNYKEGRDFEAGDSYLAGVLTDNFDICTDPNRPDLFLEIDYFTGHEPSDEMYSEVIEAFSDAGIILHYKIDQTNLALSTTTNPDHDSDGVETLRNEDEQSDLLDSTRNAAYSDYIHLIFAHYMEDDDLPGWTLYGGAKSADTTADLTESGILLADQALKDISSIYSTLLERRIKVVVHEVGHALGASHEKNTGSYNAIIDGPGPSDIKNNYNVMIQNALDSTVGNSLLRGVGNTDRRFGATEDIGRPRFSIESIAQFDLTNKLSVDTGRNIDILDQYV
jgi:hypothetical protein